MSRNEELHYLRGQLLILEKLQGERFTPCRQSNALAHFLKSQTISVKADIKKIEDELRQN
jgi:hypothetical protein